MLSEIRDQTSEIRNPPLLRYGGQVRDHTSAFSLVGKSECRAQIQKSKNLKIPNPPFHYLCARVFRKPIIQQLTGFLLLLVFALSTAPKSYFHDLVADHHDDVLSCDLAHKTSVLHKKAYHCDCDDLVVSTPFVFQQEFYSVSLLKYFPVKQEFIHFVFAAEFPNRHDSRGPPVC